MAFNLFPQTDFRQLDLNYVLDVSKQAAANLEEYTADKEQVIATQAAAEEALAAAQQDIQTATQAAASASQDSQTATQAAGTATQAAASAEQDAQTASAAAQTALDVQESIPADYSVLSADVDNLKIVLKLKAWDIGSYNRFDKDTATAGKLINKTGTITDNAYWSISDYIPVDEGMVLYAFAHSAGNFCLFDFNKNIVSTSQTPNWANPFTVPNGVCYIRMSFHTENIAVAYLSTVNSFDAYKKLAQYARDNVERIDSETALLAKDDVVFTTGHFLNKTTGAEVSNAQYAVTDFISLIGIAKKYKYKLFSYDGVALYCFYDNNKGFISSVSSESATLTEIAGTVDTIPNNAEYIRFCSSISYGSVSYTPYLGITKIGGIKLTGEYTNLESVAFKKHDERTNLIDLDKVTSGYYVRGTDGVLVASSGYYATDFIELEPETEYYFNANYLYFGYAAFYDENKTYISGYGAGNSENHMPSPVKTPAYTKYGRFTIASESRLANAWLCATNQMATKPANWNQKIETEFISERPTDYEGHEISVFTKILCIGDSLTDGFFNESGGSRLIMRNRAYPAKLQALTGIETTNMGYAGYTSVQWYTAYQNEDLSGHDACIIQLGVNDALQSVATADTTTAFQNIITKVKTDNPGIKIFVATILPGNGYMLASMRTMSETIRTIVAGLNDDDVYLVDLWTYGHTNDYLAYDAGHLSALGYLRLAEDYKAYISYIIHTHVNDFRYVQFVNTNYVYDGATEVRAISYT